MLQIHNPATGELVWEVPSQSADEVQAAIARAQAAWPAWRARTALERSQLVRRIGEALLARTDDLATTITMECGKPLSEAKGEVAYAASYFTWFAEEARRVYGETIPANQVNRRILVQHEPVGVCAAITPWNFPLAMIARKVAPALAAGCTMLVKPAESTPLSALALADIAAEAGLPTGVLQVLTGDPVMIGQQLCTSPVVRKLSFTGSTATGRLLYAQCAPTIKRLSLELGGNAPFIVFDDADLTAAVEGLMASKFRFSGQTCVCANRVFVQSGIYDAFVTALSERVARLRVGNGLEAGVEQGPLINEQALAKVERHIADATSKGARVRTGGKRHELGRTFYTPTVLTECSTEMACAQEETFGPVAPIFRFSDEADALRLANATEVGLAAYIFTRDNARVWRVAEALEVGMVGINTGLISTEVAPFGGVKQSGLGREGSRHGIADYLSTKYIAVQI